MLECSVGERFSCLKCYVEIYSTKKVKENMFESL